MLKNTLCILPRKHCHPGHNTQKLSLFSLDLGVCLWVMAITVQGFSDGSEIGVPVAAGGGQTHWFCRRPQAALVVSRMRSDIFSTGLAGPPAAAACLV